MIRRARVGDTALNIEAGNPESIAFALDCAVSELSELDRFRMARRARRHAARFDRLNVFDALCKRLPL